MVIRGIQNSHIMMLIIKNITVSEFIGFILKFKRNTFRVVNCKNQPASSKST